jgi:hypothetical protein
VVTAARVGGADHQQERDRPADTDRTSFVDGTNIDSVADLTVADLTEAGTR